MTTVDPRPPRPARDRGSGEPCTIYVPPEYCSDVEHCRVHRGAYDVAPTEPAPVLEPAAEPPTRDAPEDPYLTAARAHAVKDVEIIGVTPTEALHADWIGRLAADSRHRAAVDAVREPLLAVLAQADRDQARTDRYLIEAQAQRDEARKQEADFRATLAADGFVAMRVEEVDQLRRERDDARKLAHLTSIDQNAGAQMLGEARTERDEAHAVLADLVDPDACGLDEWGGCAAHTWAASNESQCPHARAKELLAQDGGDDA